MSAPRLFTVVAAAGSGARLGAGVRKAAVEIAGLPLVVHALRAIRHSPGASAGGLVVHTDDLDRARAEWIPAAHAPYPWAVVAGGETRAESIAAGLAELPEDAELVLVHDAARPLVHREDLAAVVAAARESGAAILAAPVTDTLKRVRDGRIVEGVDRTELWGAQTPQVFRREALERARRAGPPRGTDEASWLLAGGVEVRVVESRHANPKLTHPSDLDGMIARLTARAAE